MNRKPNINQMPEECTLFEGELARREAGRLLVRQEAVLLTWTFDGLLAADGISLELRYGARVRALDEPAERQMLTEAFFTGNSSLTGKEAAAYFSPSLESAARGVLASRPAADWVAPGADLTEPLDAMRKAGAATAFTCGLEWLSPFQLDLTSRALRTQRAAASGRLLAERENAERMAHLERSIALMEQFNRLRQAAPDLSAGRLLERIAPADRADVLQSSLLASANAQPTQTLYMLAGPQLLWLDEQSSQVQLLSLPSTLGLPRSIRGVEVEGQRRLLIGAQRGVLLADPDNPADAIAYPLDSADSPLGFNSALILGRSLYATHSTTGLVRWNVNDPAVPAESVALPVRAIADEGARLVNYQATSGLMMTAGSTTHGESMTPGPRLLTKMDDIRALFSIGAKAYMLEEGQISAISSPASSHPIIAIVSPSEVGELHSMGDVAMVYADGMVQRMEYGGLKIISTEPRAGRLTAAGVLPWMSVPRLLLATAEGPILCIGLDDSVATQYQSLQRGFRRVVASAGWVAGISADRQRVVLWGAASPQAPFSELPIARLAGHRVADLAFV